MEFWDTVGSVAKAGMNSLNEYNAGDAGVESEI